MVLDQTPQIGCADIAKTISFEALAMEKEQRESRRKLFPLTLQQWKILQDLHLDRY